MLAAALAGIGGGLFTFSFQFVSPEAFPVVLSVEFVVMVAVGGLGNVYGAVAGTVAILYLEQKLRELGTTRGTPRLEPAGPAPTVFSYGVFGLVLISSCCSSRAGCSLRSARTRLLVRAVPRSAYFFFLSNAAPVRGFGLPP